MDFCLCRASSLDIGFRLPVTSRTTVDSLSARTYWIFFELELFQQWWTGSHGYEARCLALA
jgi:hypothetical protein